MTECPECGAALDEGALELYRDSLAALAIGILEGSSKGIEIGWAWYLQWRNMTGPAPLPDDSEDDLVANIKWLDEVWR